MAGRPRNTELDARLTDAARQLLAEQGYAATTMDAIAARSGVPKSAMYRRWTSKGDLVFTAVVHPDVLDVADTGALDSDLRDLTARIVRSLATPAARAAMPGLLHDLTGDDGGRLRDAVLAQRTVVGVVVDRALARGDLTPPVDVAGLHAALLGTAFAWTVLIPGPPPTDLAGRLTALAHTLLRTPGGPSCSTP